MKAVIQRIKSAAVTINGATIGKINIGLLVLIAIAPGDGIKTIDWFSNKLINLRIFNDSEEKMNLSVKDIGGEILVVSNFTIYAETQRGFRPSFSNSSSSDEAEPIYNQLIAKLKESGIKIETGRFGADMEVSLVNDGPVTLIMEK